MSTVEIEDLFDGESLWHRLSHLNPVDIWIQGIKGVLSLVMLTLVVALVGSALKTFGEIGLILNQSADDGLHQVIIDMLILLTLVSVYTITITYLREGRVKVILIVDTILVVMLAEVISQWFNEGD